LTKPFLVYIIVLFPLIEKNKEVYMTPFKDVKASKFTQEKTNKGSV
jgi:hypothetical protein